MLRDNLGPLPSVQIVQVSSFSSVLINRFHCMCLSPGWETENLFGVRGGSSGRGLWGLEILPQVEPQTGNLRQKSSAKGGRHALTVSGRSGNCKEANGVCSH